MSAKLPFNRREGNNSYRDVPHVVMSVSFTRVAAQTVSFFTVISFSSKLVWWKGERAYPVKAILNLIALDEGERLLFESRGRSRG